MNEKNRWKIAIGSGIVLNCALAGGLLFALTQLPAPQPPPQQPILTLVKVPPPDAAPPQKVKVAPVPPTPLKHAIVDDKAPTQKAAPPQPKPSPPKAPQPPPPNTANQQAAPNTAKVPPRYPMPSLKGINLAADFDVLHPPQTPQPLPGNKYPVLPPDVPPLTSSKSVEITFMVEKDGSVKRANVTKTSGNEAIDNAALATVYTWHFKPLKKAYPIPIPELFVFAAAK